MDNKFLINCTVEHINLGIGIITNIDDNYIYVCIDFENYTFPFPMIFEKYLIVENDEIKTKVKKLISNESAMKMKAKADAYVKAIAGNKISAKVTNSSEWLEINAKKEKEKEAKKKAAVLERKERLIKLKEFEKQRQLEQLRINKENKNKLLIKLNEYGFEGFHHYTDFNNFIKIFRSQKLFSRSSMNNREYVDAADVKVISQTNSRIFDYVRFFYKEKSPTIYANEGIKKIDFLEKSPHMPLPVLLIFSENIIFHENVAFLDGCGGSKSSTFTENISEALKFNWDNIFSRGFIPTNNDDFDLYGYDIEHNKIKNQRNAEFLYLNNIETSHIKKIIFRSYTDLKQAQEILGLSNLYLVDRNKFNNNHNYIIDYAIKDKNNKVILTLIFNKNPEDDFNYLKLKYKNGSSEEFDLKNTFNNSNRYKFKDYIYTFDIDLTDLNLISLKEIKYYLNNVQCFKWVIKND